MFGIHDFLLFFMASLLLNITPGADMLYTFSSSARNGTRAGLVAAVGIFSGMLFHIGFAVIGLSALLAASATAFAVVKYVGAAYLIYLGVQLLWERKHPTTAKATELPVIAQKNLWKIYQQGVLIDLLNPKVALFFLAFLPQFIDVASPQKASAFLLLGLTINLSGICVNSLAAIAASAVKQRLQTAGRLGRWMKRTAGGLFVAIGINLAAH